MRMRTLLATAVTGVVVVSSATPCFAAKPKPKPKPKPIVGSYTATAAPDPTSTSQVPGAGIACKPTSPAGKDSHAFTIPAAGTLHVELANQLDWSLAIRDAAGEDLATSEGDAPTTQEATEAVFKSKQAVKIDACNFLGEPSVLVSYTFTYK
jgi:hypothetical protein